MIAVSPTRKIQGGLVRAAIGRFGGIKVELKAVARLVRAHTAAVPNEDRWGRASQRFAGLAENLCTRSPRSVSKLDRGLMMSANVPTL